MLGYLFFLSPNSYGTLLFEAIPLPYHIVRETNAILILVVFLKFLIGYVFLSTHRGNKIGVKNNRFHLIYRKGLFNMVSST